MIRLLAKPMVIASVLLCAVLLVMPLGCSHSRIDPSVVGRWNSSTAEAAPGVQRQLWIIVADPKAFAATQPAVGAFATNANGRPVRVKVGELQVAADFVGPCATTRFTQSIANLNREAVSVRYRLAVPKGAALQDFVLTIDGREIRGVVRPEKQAQAIFADARALGFTSVLLMGLGQVPRQELANLGPGESATLNARYFQTLPPTKDWLEYQLPPQKQPGTLMAGWRHLKPTRIEAPARDEIYSKPHTMMLRFAGDRPVSIRWQLPKREGVTLLLTDDKTDPAACFWLPSDDRSLNVEGITPKWVASDSPQLQYARLKSADDAKTMRVLLDDRAATVTAYPAPEGLKHWLLHLDGTATAGLLVDGTRRVRHKAESTTQPVD